MFANCFGLEEVNLSGLDISLCTNKEKMFFNCKKLKAWNYLVPKRLDLAMKRTEDKFV